jgi:hypothetical protein
LTGVAPIPWRAITAEQALRGAEPSHELFVHAGQVAVAKAQRLTNNGYKVPLARRLIERALAALTAGDESSRQILEEVPMTDDREPAPFREAPEAGVGGEGAPFDQTVLAPVSDPEIERAIRAAFELAGDVESDHFTIRVEDGVAYITAHDAAPEERRRAVEIAGMVHGVRRVVDASAT